MNNIRYGAARPLTYRVDNYSVSPRRIHGLIDLSEPTVAEAQLEQIFSRHNVTRLHRQKCCDSRHDSRSVHRP